MKNVIPSTLSEIRELADAFLSVNSAAVSVNIFAKFGDDIVEVTVDRNGVIKIAVPD